MIVFSSQIRKRINGGILQAKEVAKFSLKKKELYHVLRVDFSRLLAFCLSGIWLCSARTLASAAACDGEVREPAKGAGVWGFYILRRAICASTFMSGNHKLLKKGSIKLVGLSITEASLTFRGSGLVDGCLHSFA